MSALPAAPSSLSIKSTLSFTKTKKVNLFSNRTNMRSRENRRKTHDRILSCRCVILFETILCDILSIHQVSKFSICLVDNESKSIGTNHSWPLNQKYMNIHRVHNICFDIWCWKDGSIRVVGWYLNAAKWELYFLFCSTELWGDHTTWSNIDFEKYFIIFTAPPASVGGIYPTYLHFTS